MRLHSLSRVVLLCLPLIATPVLAQDAARSHAEARELLRVGRFDEAVARLNATLKQKPDLAPAWYDLGYAFRRLNRHVDAIRAYAEFARLRPSDPGALYGLGLAFQGAGDRAAALRSLRRYVEIEKRAGEQKWVTRAKEIIAQLSAPPAAPAPVAPTRPAPAPAAPTRPAPAAAPPAAPAVTAVHAAALQAPRLKAEGDQARARGDHEAAIKYYRAALQANPRLVDAWNELGNILFQKQRFGEAVDAFRGALKLDPVFALGWYNLAHSLRKLGRNGEAVEAYLRYTKLRSDDPDPWYSLGLAYKDLGDLGTALWALTRYVEIEKRPSEARYVEAARVLAAELARRGARPTPAGSGAPAAAPGPAPAAPAPAPPPGPAPAPAPAPAARPAPPPAAPPASSLGPQALGDQARAVGDLAAATAHYRVAVERSASDLVARRRLAQVLADTRRLREAIAQLEIVLWQTPKDGALRALVGALRARLGKEGEGPAVTMARVREAVAARKLTFARADAEGLVAARPKDPEALALRGEVLLASGDARAALADFQRALELGPPRPHLLFGQAEALRGVGENAKARLAYDHFLKNGGAEAWRVSAAQRALAELPR